MRQNFRGWMSEQITARQAFEKIIEPFSDLQSQSAEMRHYLVVRVHMQTLIQAAVQVVRGGDVKLPDVLGFPWSESLRIYGLDVPIGEQAKHFQALRCFLFVGERANCFRIENIAAQCGAHFQMPPDQEDKNLAVGFV